MDISAEELAAASNAFGNQNKQTETPEVKVETPAPEAQNTTTEKPVESSLKDAEVKPEVKAEPAAEVKTETPPAKSFDDYLVEKTGGKFKKWDDVEQVLNAPKEELDEEIKHLQSLKSKGIKLDKEFFELQSLDVENMTDPEEIVLESMRRKPEYKGLSEKTLRVELNRKYNIDEWIDKDEAELTDEDIANREIMMRDAHNDKDWLQNYKKERTFVPEPDKAELELQAAERKQRLQNFEKFVDEELAGKVTSLSIEIDKNTNETFEYKISEADRKGVADMMKLLPVDLAVLVNQFAEKDDSGNLKVNDRKVYEMLVKSRTFDEAVKNAYKDGKAEGAKKFVKEEIKNVSFTASGHSTGNPIANTEGEALALAMKAQGKSIL